MKIYDISITLNNQTINYPNNPEIKIEKFASLPESSSNLTKITIGSHTGTHIDAPLHAIEDGLPIDQMNLESFLGKAYVYDFSYLERGQGISVEDFKNKREPEESEIVLVKTSNSERGYESFYNDFVYLEGDAAVYLADRNIKLFGIDFLSVKQKGSTDNRSHHALLEKNIPIVEGLSFKDVPEGEYQFIALPLKLEGVDGSPTRAVLIA